MSSIVTERIALATRGNDDLIDVTPQVRDVVTRHALRQGSVLVFIAGSTASITTIEYEPGLRRDFPAALERLAPRAMDYAHHRAAGDNNGHAHVRASVLGPSLTIPVADGRLLLGTWQQIVLIDHDVHPRERELIVQLSGEREETL